MLKFQHPEFLVPQTLAKLPVLEPQTRLPVLHPVTKLPVLHPLTKLPVLQPQTKLPVLQPQTKLPKQHHGTKVTKSAISGKQPVQTFNTKGTITQIPGMGLAKLVKGIINCRAIGRFWLQFVWGSSK